MEPKLVLVVDQVDQGLGVFFGKLHHDAGTVEMGYDQIRRPIFLLLGSTRIGKYFDPIQAPMPIAKRASAGDDSAFVSAFCHAGHNPMKPPLRPRIMSEWVAVHVGQNSHDSSPLHIVFRTNKKGPLFRGALSQC